MIKPLKLVPLRKKSIALISLILVLFLLSSNANVTQFLYQKFSVDLTATLSADVVESCVDAPIQLTFDGSGGISPYTFEYTVNGVQKEITTILGLSTATLSVGDIGSHSYVLQKVKDGSSAEKVISASSLAVQIYSAPTVDFTFVNDGACSGENVVFTNASSGTGALSYAWDFGDGSTSNDTNPVHVFDFVGVGQTKDFEVQLTVTDENGCGTSVTKQVKVEGKLNVSFRDAASGNFVFNNCGSASADTPNYSVEVENISNDIGVVGSYVVDWGDGTPLATVSFPVSHTYTSLGVYEMKITASASATCPTTKSYSVINVSNPAGGFASPGSTTDLCAPTAFLDFGISNWGTNSLDTKYTVDFGDGSPIEIYTQQDLESSSAFNASSPKDSGTFLTPHSYTKGSCLLTDQQYVAKLSIENACSATLFTISNIRILESSVAKFEMVENSCVDNNVLFENKSVIGDASGCIDRADFIWDFGDGTEETLYSQSTSSNINHSFASPGIYTVSLKVKSNCGIAEFSKNICIAPNRLATFSTDVDEVCVLLPVKATNKMDTDLLCSLPSFLWEVTYNSENCGTVAKWRFTNGTNASSENPEFLFETPGEYKLKQTVQTDCGPKTHTKSIQVKKPPTATIDPLNACGVLTVHPQAQVENCTQDSSEISYEWNFSGGTPASATTLDPGVITYATPGNYEATLVVTNDCGISTEAKTVIEIVEKPVITNTDLTRELCANQVLQEIELKASVVGTTFSWNASASPGVAGFISNGTSDKIPEQTFSNTTSSVGTVTYTITPAVNGCQGEKVAILVTVNPTPIISLQPTPATLCLGGAAPLLEVAFENGTGSPSYQWYEHTVASNTGGVLMSGANYANYTPTVTAVGTKYYYAEISFSSGECFAIVSDPVAVKVQEQIMIDPASDPQNLCVGGTAEPFEVSYSGGDGAPSFQWYSNTTPTNSGGALISSATNKQYTPPAFTSVGNKYYYAEVSLSGEGCTTAVSEVYTVAVVAPPVVTKQPITSQELCQGAPASPLKFEVSGGVTSTYNYQWYSNSAASQVGATEVIGATSASYTPKSIQVGEVFYYAEISQPVSGCTVLSDFSSLKINASPSISQQPIAYELCLGANATPLNFSHANGTGIPSYQWFVSSDTSVTTGSPIVGATATDFTPPVDTVGTHYYYAEVTFSSGGCSQVRTHMVSVTVHPVPQIQTANFQVVSGTLFTFDPADVLANIVPVNTEYTWSFPSGDSQNKLQGATAANSPMTNFSQTILNSGLDPIELRYSVTPRTAHCDGAAFELVLTVLPPLRLDAQVTNVSCFEVDDATITTDVQGGWPFSSGDPYKYKWTGPNGFTSSSSSITGLEAGTYSVEIQDSKGNLLRKDWELTTPSLLAIENDSLQDISCIGAKDGKIEMSVTGGTSPYTYKWTLNGGDLTANSLQLSDLEKGNYELLVTDENGCTTSNIVEIKEPEALKIDKLSQQNVLCNGAATGAIDLEVSGGTLKEITPGVFDYTYVWEGPGGFRRSTQNLNDIEAGAYKLTVIDKNNCTTSVDFVVTEIDAMLLSYTKSDVTCSGANDASIQLDIQGGTAPYIVLWNTFVEGVQLDNLSGGTYTATVTDANGCEQSISIEIVESTFSVSSKISQISCYGSENGSIELKVSGGIAPISVQWEDANNVGTLRNNLAPGTYRVRVTDSDPDSCPFIEEFVLVDPTQIAVTSTVTDAFDCVVANSGSIDLQVSGGTAPYSFLWNTGASSEDLVNIAAGSYTVEITDNNGCTSNQKFDIQRQDPLALTLVETDNRDCSISVIGKKITAQVTGGFPPYSYTWPDGFVVSENSNNAVVTNSNNYVVIVKDDRGCEIRQLFSVDLPSEIEAFEFSYDALSQAQTGLLSIGDPIQFSNLSTPGYVSVLWDFGDGSPFINDADPVHTYDIKGVYEVVLTLQYASGCEEQITRSIDITKAYSLVNPTAFSPNGDGYNDVIRPLHRGFREIEMTVYNTWGASVYYEKSQYFKGWDGKIDGEYAENGNYVLVVKGTTFYGKEVTETTPLILLR